MVQPYQNSAAQILDLHHLFILCTHIDSNPLSLLAVDSVDLTRPKPCSDEALTLGAKFAKETFLLKKRMIQVFSLT
jgi:hypothetical protein